MNKRWVVYYLADKSGVRYIGITSMTLKQRLRYHKHRNTPKKGLANWIAEMRKWGLHPDIEPLDTFIGTHAEAEQIERQYIRLYLALGHDLWNQNYIPGDKHDFVAFLRGQKLVLQPPG